MAPTASSRLTSHARCVMPSGVGNGVERRALFGGAQDDIHDGRGLVGGRRGARLHFELGDRARSGGHVSAGIALVARKYTRRANR